MTETDGARAGLETRILEDIVLARHIGVRVLTCEAGSVVLGAPLAANSNHHGTAFGGSLYALAVLAGWGVLTVELERRGVDAELVVQDGHIEYFVPVTSDFTARAALPEPTALDRCLRALARYGRARIEVSVVVEADGAEAVRLIGTYAIRRAAG